MSAYLRTFNFTLKVKIPQQNKTQQKPKQKSPKNQKNRALMPVALQQCAQYLYYNTSSTRAHTAF